MDLDRSSPVPLYFQVSRQIEAAIEAGQLAPGDRLENEISLADRWGLSRPTMRRAIQELVDKGLLVRRRGIGTQVVHGRVKRPIELTSLFDDLARSDQKPGTRVLDRELAAAPAAVAEQLGVPVGTQVLHLERLRSARDEPLAVMRNWLPADLAPVLTAEALEARGLYELMRGTGRAPADRHPADRRPRGDRAGGQAARAAQGRAAADDGAGHLRRLRPRGRVRQPRLQRARPTPSR